MCHCCPVFSEDNRVLLWDVRSAKGNLMILDQHNGDTSAGPNSGNLITLFMV